MDIKIIVPVFNAFDVFQNLIKSLIEHNAKDDILFIDDASTDERIIELTSNLPINWKVIQNEENLGFVKTANIGLKASAGHSILLNSDTLVTEGWLTRFKQCVRQVQDLGTATPWSNNAEICSLPKTLQSNPIPLDLNGVSQQLLQHHPTYPEIPTAVGFCMLITAAAKEHVGYFDEQVFGMGYGEENDYSLRVSQSGLRNVLVDNCYVAHIGNQSFQEISLKPNEQTMARLLKKHPGYLQQIQNFIDKDPLHDLRQTITAKIDAF